MTNPAAQVFHERLATPRYARFKSHVARMGRFNMTWMIESLFQDFQKFGFRTTPLTGGGVLHDGIVEIRIEVGEEGLPHAFCGDMELGLAEQAAASLVFDPTENSWYGPALRTWQLLGHERVAQVVRDLSARGAPIVRISAREVLTELIFEALQEAARMD